MKTIFENIYKHKIWQETIGTESGPGSSISCSREYLHFLSRFVNSNKITTMLELGCGDFNLMKYFNFDSVVYTGVDVVESVIQNNILKYKTSNVNFIESDILKYKWVDKIDLVIIKDVFQHWSNISILDYIQSTLKNYKYAVITNDSTENNVDINNGDWRPINIKLSPFCIKTVGEFSWKSCPFHKTSYIITSESYV